MGKNNERGLPEALPDKEEEKSIVMTETAIIEGDSATEKPTRVEHEEMFNEPNLAPVKKNRRGRKKGCAAGPGRPQGSGFDAPERIEGPEVEIVPLVAAANVFVESDSEDEDPPQPVIPAGYVLTAKGKIVSKKRMENLASARLKAAANRKAKKLAKAEVDTRYMGEVLTQEAPVRHRQEQAQIQAVDIERIATNAIRKEKAARKSVKQAKIDKANEIAEIRKSAKLELLEEQRQLLSQQKASAPRQIAKPVKKKQLTASDLMHGSKPSISNHYLFSGMY